MLGRRVAPNSSMGRLSAPLGFRSALVRLLSDHLLPVPVSLAPRWRSGLGIFPSSTQRPSGPTTGSPAEPGPEPDEDETEPLPRLGVLSETTLVAPGAIPNSSASSCSELGDSRFSETDWDLPRGRRRDLCPCELDRASVVDDARERSIREAAVLGAVAGESPNDEVEGMFRSWGGSVERTNDRWSNDDGGGGETGSGPMEHRREGMLPMTVAGGRMIRGMRRKLGVITKKEECCGWEPGVQRPGGQVRGRRASQVRIAQMSDRVPDRSGPGERAKSERMAIKSLRAI